MSKSHHYRSSLLGSDTAYQPLSGNSSFSSTRPPIYNPMGQSDAYESGGYHDREGLPTRGTAPAASNRSSKLYVPNTTWTWAFMLIVLLQALISLAFEAYVFGEYQVSLDTHDNPEHVDVDTLDKNPTKTIPTYLALFIFGYLYELLLAWDALRLKNTIQVIGIVLYNAGMLIYSAVQVNQIDDAVKVLLYVQEVDPTTWNSLRPFLIAAPCVVALGTILLAFVAWKLYNEFAWTIYKHISADLRLKRRYLTYQIYIALLKFDFFFFLGFTVQFLVVVTTTHDPEFYLTLAAVPITVLLLLLAAWFTRRESYVGQVGILIVYFAAMAYFVFKLVRMYAPGPKQHDYDAAKASLTTFAVLTLLLDIVTIGTAVVCMMNFNKGLKPHIQRRKVPNTGELDGGKWGAGDFNGPPHPLGAVPSRMTID